MRATRTLTFVLSVATSVAMHGQSTAPESKSAPATGEVAKNTLPPVSPIKLADLPTALQTSVAAASAAALQTPPPPAPKDPVASVTAETVVPGAVMPGAARSQAISPQAVRMEPRSAKPGTIITITGVALGKESVDEVFLTDHRFDMKVKVLEQTETSLKIRVPPFLKPGRQQLLLLTAGNVQTYLEQPFFVQIESKEDEEGKELAQSPAKEPAAAEKGASNGSNSPEIK